MRLSQQKTPAVGAGASMEISMLMHDNTVAVAANSSPEEPAANSRERGWFSRALTVGRTQRVCEIVRITPGLAAEMLTHNSHNRPLTKGLTQKYASVMLEGRWKLSPEAIAFSKSGRLLDGQHRLSACVASGVTVKMSVWFGCEEDEFLVLDGGKTRTAADHLAVDGKNYWKLRASVARAQIMLDHGERDGVDAARVRNAALDMDGPNMDLAVVVAHRAKHVVKVPAAALAYYHLLSSRKSYQLDAFWDSFCGGADLASNSPILRVREYLRSVRNVGLHGTYSTIKSAAAIILAWNAYVSHKSPRSYAWPHTRTLPEIL